MPLSRVSGLLRRRKYILEIPRTIISPLRWSFVLTSCFAFLFMPAPPLPVLLPIFSLRISAPVPQILTIQQE